MIFQIQYRMVLAVGNGGKAIPICCLKKPFCIYNEGLTCLNGRPLQKVSVQWLPISLIASWSFWTKLAMVG
jgi:hypothetical protein